MVTMMITMTMTTGHLGPRLPGSFCFSSHRSLQLNWQAHVFHLLVMVNNCENFSLRRIEWHKKNQQFQWQFEWSQIDKRKCMVSAASPQPFRLWLPKVPWPRPGSPRTKNNMRFEPRNPESQNFHLYNFHLCNIQKFLTKDLLFFPFTRTCMSCAMLSLSDKMSPRFFVPKTFLDCWTTLWWLSDKLTSMWSLPRALCFDCSHPR